MEWLKSKWEFAGAIAVVLCGFLKLFAPAGLGAWSGWTAVVFATLVIFGFWYRRSPALQALLAKTQKAAGAEAISQSQDNRAFRGLIPFGEQDANEFSKLGRKMDVAALLPRIRDIELRAIVLRGDSGSGKTSLIRAGLLPTLRDEGWIIVDIEPAMSGPASAIQNVSDFESNQRLLIVADQFEEQFFRSDTARDNFSEALRDSVEQGKAKWLIGVRADFKYLIDDLMERFGGAFQRKFLDPRVGYGLRLFTIDEARAVLSEIGGDVLEPGTALQLSYDLSRDSKVLPADLQFVGFEMQQRGISSLEQYRAAGGRDGIVADSIRNVIDHFPGEDRKLDARKILSSLIDQEHGTRLAEPITGSELAARAGIAAAMVESYCDPFVKQRLILRVADASDRAARYRLAHDYLVQPIYTAIGHTETDYEKAVRLLTVYAGEFGRNPRVRIPPYDYNLIRRIVRKVGRNAALEEAFERAKPVIRATQRERLQRAMVVLPILFLLVLFIPPIRTGIELKITHLLNAGMGSSQPKGRPHFVDLSGQKLLGDKAVLFQYARVPFVRRFPIPEVVKCPSSVCSSFAVGRFDVTVAQFNAFAVASGHHEIPGKPNLPATAVSWDDADSYAQWLSQVTGRQFRLPTGVEWEALCRVGGTKAASTIGDFAWDFENTPDSTPQPVGEKKPNALGLYDMIGNVEQWVADYDTDWGLRYARGGNYTNKADELTCNASQEYSPQQAAPDVVGFRVLDDLSR
jgi:hypothetical protein